MNIREKIEEREKNTLSKFAAFSADSQGRGVYENPDDVRTCYAIDRDRIIHSYAFRREKDKTQVFILPSNDHCMNRLTHTLEVAQVAKSIAVALGLNETLAEAIALGHDTAHTCFGHAGEKALNSLYSGGYSHADEAKRRLNFLEGKNLTKEVLDGIAKHSGLTNMPNATTLEGQIVPFADKIAYLTSDYENAIEMGIIKGLPERVISNLGKTKGEIMNTLISSIILTSLDKNQIAMDDKTYEELVFFRNFAFNEIYFSKKLLEENRKAEHIIQHLYEYFVNNPEEMAHITDVNDIERSVVDYIAGMTDNYALTTYEKHFSLRHI